jgi:outer membrane protein OmpA-like peptidoglycan-associated protein
VKKIVKLSGAAVLTGAALMLTGCKLTGLEAGAAGVSAGPPVAITTSVTPSALVAVLDGRASGSAFAELVAETARAREDLAVLEAGTPSKAVLSSVSPDPPTVTVAGQPAAPGANATSYQMAQYANRLKQWRGKVAAGRLAEAAQARASLSQWLHGLTLATRLGGLTDPPAETSSLAAECAVAASTLVGLEQQKNGVAGRHRVIVLYTANLSGRLPAGELTGDTVIVVTPFLPTAAASSAAQADLLTAGAAQAAVIGPEITSAQTAALVSADLSQGGGRESASAPVLFANASASLSRSAVAQLHALLPRLLAPGATAVINGYASTTGSALTNYNLSYARASAVAAYFESNGVPVSSLIIVGHGASDPVAAGDSGRNRRVVIVIEAP